MIEEENSSTSSSSHSSNASISQDDSGDPNERLDHVIELPPCDEALDDSLPPLPSAATRVNVTSSQHVHIGNNYDIRTPQVNFIITNKDVMEIKSLTGQANGDQNGLLSLLFNRCFPCTQVNEGTSEHQNAIEAEPTRSLAITEGDAEKVNDVENAIETLLPENVQLNGTMGIPKLLDVGNAIEALLPEGVQLNTTGIRSPKVLAEWDMSESHVTAHSIFRCCFSNPPRGRKEKHQNVVAEALPMQQLKSQMEVEHEGGENAKGPANTKCGENETDSNPKCKHTFFMELPRARLAVRLSKILVFSIACALIAMFIVDSLNSGYTNYEYDFKDSTVLKTNGWTSQPTPTQDTSTRNGSEIDESPELDKDINWQSFGLVEDEKELYGMS